MKNLIIILVTVLFHSITIGQNQNIRLDGVYLNTVAFDETDLFNGVQISNITSEIQEINLIGILSDQNGRKLIEIHAKGSINEGGSLENIEITNSRDFTGVLLDYIKTTGIIPQSLMTFCVKVSQNSGAFEELCYTQTSFINHQLNLQYPYDKEEINNLRPSLFWTYSGHTSEVTYNVIVKKKGSSKSNTAGFNFGQPVLSVDRVINTDLDFPAELPDLEEGETYLWQVEAFIQNISLGKTDIWEFKIGEPFDISGLPISKSYIDIDEIVGEPLIYVLGTIKLKIIESKKAGSFSYKIVQESKKNKKAKVLGKDELIVNMRENYYDIDLKDKYYLTHKKKYTIEIKRSGVKDVVRIHFIYLNPDYIK